MDYKKRTDSKHKQEYIFLNTGRDYIPVQESDSKRQGKYKR